MEQKMFATENAPNGTKNVTWRAKKMFLKDFRRS